MLGDLLCHNAEVVDLKQLEYFIRVAELGSFTRASIALNIAQPAISRQVRLLEVELRQNLLVRNGRGATPTEAGKLLLEHGRGILHQVAVAREEMGAARGALSGRVSIGLPPSLSKLVTVPLTQAFRNRLPHAHLTLTEGFSLLMHEGLRLGNLDLVVLYNPESSPEIEQQTLHAEELVLISPRGTTTPTKASPRARTARPARTGKAAATTGTEGNAAQWRQPIALRDVADLPLIIPSRPNAFRMLIEDEVMSLGRSIKVALEVDGLNAILSLVHEGMGHAVLPRYTLANFGDASPFVLRAIRSPRILSELKLVWSARRPATQTQRLAMDLVRDVVRQAIEPYT